MIFSLKILKNYIVRCDFWAGDKLSPAVLFILDIRSTSQQKSKM